MAKQCQSEQTVRRHTALVLALLSLLRTRSLQEISVKDICQTADIPRRTFYHYFTGKEDLVAALIRDLLLDCDLAILPQSTDGPDRQRESLARFFRFWQQTHRETLELLLKNEQAPHIIRQAHQWICREHLHTADSAQASDPRQLVGLATISGVYSLLFFWFQTGFQQSAEEMADHAARFLTQPLVLW